MAITSSEFQETLYDELLALKKVSEREQAEIDSVNKQIRNLNKLKGRLMDQHEITRKELNSKADALEVYISINHSLMEP